MELNEYICIYVYRLHIYASYQHDRFKTAFTHVFESYKIITTGIYVYIGTAAYPHSGTVSTHGIDTRAEIGILTHDIKIYGEMEPACYGSNFCQ
jgi:hypothetical protein